MDSAGNLYIADSGNSRIRKVSNGVITTVAGNGTQGFGGDNGPTTSAQLWDPWGVAVDSAGNLYIADTDNSRIRKVSNGVITTVAGNGTGGFNGDDGPATSAALYGPEGIAVDSAGNLYIADTYNYRIRKVSNGVITTVAGNGTGGFNGDNGPATSALLYNPSGVAVDSAGNLYIADTGTNRIRKVSNAVITTVAGNGTPGFSGDNGPATSAELNVIGAAEYGPFYDNGGGVAVDSAGNLYIADTYNNRIRKVSNGVITTVAGNGTRFGGDNGPAMSAQLHDPEGVAVDSAGNLYIADTGNNRIRKVSNGVITTAAGNGTTGFSGDNGPAASAELYSPGGVVADSAGNLYIGDTNNNRIRKVSNGVITTVAGDGTYGFSGDNGPATSAELHAPWGVAVDSASNLYISDFLNSRIRKVSNGVITTVAGNGANGFRNGPATSAELYYPLGVAVDSAGNLYIADTNNNRVRKVSNGAITTVAGNGDCCSYIGDNGPATSAELSSPRGVAVDSAGNLYIADTGNSRIRKVSDGVITTVAGNGTGGFSGDDGPATSAQLNGPEDVAVDSAGNLYIADLGNNRIRILTPGESQTITFGSLSNQILGNPPFSLSATASSGLAVMFTSNSTAVCTVSGATVTLVAAGTCSLTASQPGNASFGAATPVTQSFAVSAASGATPQTITFGPLGSVTFGTAPFAINATASSGLTVSFASTTPGVCTVSGSTVTVVAVGTCSITASQAGNSIYAAAIPVIQAFTVSAAIPKRALQLVTVAPCRIMDTRNADGPFGGPFIAGRTARTIPIPSSACGIPANAAAYSLNFTVVPRAGALSYLTVWPTGRAQPIVSTLNSLDGSTIANAAMVPAGTAGAVSAYATDDTGLVVDINGYFAPPAANTLEFYPLPPCRVLDTRNANGTFGGPSIAGGSSRSFPIPSSSCGVPASAAAYAFNVTVVPQGPLGYLTAWPTGRTQPFVSTLNSFDGTTLANAAIVPAGTGGAASFYASNTTDLVVDINGYFAAPTSGGLNFYALAPCRLVDTRNANGTFGGPTMSTGTTRAFPLSQGSCGLPGVPSAQAYSLNMTVVPQGALSYLSTWPALGIQPVVSTLNAFKGQVVANAAIVPAGGTGSIDVYVTNTTDVVIDTNGYFGP